MPPSPSLAMAGPILAKLNAAMAARSMIFMVSLHLPASLPRRGHCLRPGRLPFAMPRKWVSKLRAIIGRRGIGFMRATVQKLWLWSQTALPSAVSIGSAMRFASLPH